MISHRADDLLSPQVEFSLIIVQRIIRNAKSLYKLLLLDPMGTQLEFQFKISRNIIPLEVTLEVTRMNKHRK